MSTASVAVAPRPVQVGPPRPHPRKQLVVQRQLLPQLPLTQPSRTDGEKRESAITLEQLDLTVDYDSEVEESLGPDLRALPHYDDFSECIDALGYGDNPDEFFDYSSRAKWRWDNQETRAMASRLGSLGLEQWFKTYLIDRKEPVQKLLYAFGVLLTKEQRKLDDVSLLPLLKAAAFRRMRHRNRKLEHLSPPRTNLMVEFIANIINRSRNIIVLSGAGISVSCGIPDFRSRNGLYSQLFSCGAFDLDDPQQLFDINYFKQDPSVFYSFAHKIYPSNFIPSRCHRFIRAIEKKGKLLRNYTQNIDGLESKAGIERIVQCHGSFATASCINCGVKVPGEAIKDDLLARRVPLCKVCNSESDLKPKKLRRKKKKKKQRNDGWESDETEDSFPPPPPGVMKPDITFFGEKLSKSFDKKVFRDMKSVDLVLVIGTSLKVRPVSEIITHLPHSTRTIVINKTPLSHFSPDFQLLGDADVVVNHLARKLGWDLEQDRSVQDATPNGPPPPNRRANRIKESTEHSGTVEVLGRSGVLLFKGAEGGKFVEKLIAERNVKRERDSSLPDDDIHYIVTSDSGGEPEDTDAETDASNGRVNKRPRRSLT